MLFEMSLNGNELLEMVWMICDKFKVVFWSIIYIKIYKHLQSIIAQWERFLFGSFSMNFKANGLCNVLCSKQLYVMLIQFSVRKLVNRSIRSEL